MPATENWTVSKSSSLTDLLGISQSLCLLSGSPSFRWSLAGISSAFDSRLSQFSTASPAFRFQGVCPASRSASVQALTVSYLHPLCPTQAISSLILTSSFPDNSMPLACQFHMVQPSGYSWKYRGKKFLDINILKYSKMYVSLFQHFLQGILWFSGIWLKRGHPLAFRSLPCPSHYRPWFLLAPGFSAHTVFRRVRAAHAQFALALIWQIFPQVSSRGQHETPPSPVKGLSAPKTGSSDP